MVCSYFRTYKIDKKKSYSPDIYPELYETDILVYKVCRCERFGPASL